MKIIKYLNPRLPVQMFGSRGTANVILEFPGGRKNNIWFRGCYRSPKAPWHLADFPLATLNAHERRQLEALLSLHDPEKLPVLPWNIDSLGP